MRLAYIFTPPRLLQDLQANAFTAFGNAFLAITALVISASPIPIRLPFLLVLLYSKGETFSLVAHSLVERLGSRHHRKHTQGSRRSSHPKALLNTQ